jgi:hypothetical protein
MVDEPRIWFFEIISAQSALYFCVTQAGDEPIKIEQTTAQAVNEAQEGFKTFRDTRDREVRLLTQQVAKLYSLYGSLNYWKARAPS